MKVIQRLLCFLCFLSVNSFSVEIGEIESAVVAGLEKLEDRQSKFDGSWGGGGNLDYITTLAAVNAFSGANVLNSYYLSGLAWLGNNRPSNTDTVSKKILSLSGTSNILRNDDGSYSTAVNMEPDVRLIMAAKRSDTQVGWGVSKGYIASPLETALVLKALNEIGLVSGQLEAVDYLIGAQNSDGGWGLSAGSISNDSDLWVTSEVMLALLGYMADTSVMASLNKAHFYLQGIVEKQIYINPYMYSPRTASRAALALFKFGGLDSRVENLLQVILDSGVISDDTNVLALANSVEVFSEVLGYSAYKQSERVSVENEQLRILINEALGYAQYSQLNQSDIAKLTTLDLRHINIDNLIGLSNAVNLEVIKVNALTDLSAISELDVIIIVDSDSDDIVDANDNCPFIINVSQINFDNDEFGDVCDFDIDGDLILDSWEIIYGLSQYSASDALVDLDGDNLPNLAEFENNTNPLMLDTDGDSMDDGIEIHYRFNPLDIKDGLYDFDLDGLGNAEEILVGRSPIFNEPVMVVIISSILL